MQGASSVPEIFDNLDGQQLGVALRRSLDDFASVDIATGYFDMRGWDSFREIVNAKHEALASGSGPTARLLIGMVAPSDSESILASLQREVQSANTEDDPHDRETA